MGLRRTAERSLRPPPLLHGHQAESRILQGMLLVVRVRALIHRTIHAASLLLAARPAGLRGVAEESVGCDPYTTIRRKITATATLRNCPERSSLLFLALIRRRLSDDSQSVSALSPRRPVVATTFVRNEQPGNRGGKGAIYDMYRSERFTLSLCLPRCLSLCPRLLSVVSRERVWGRSPGKWDLPASRRSRVTRSAGDSARWQAGSQRSPPARNAARLARVCTTCVHTGSSRGLR